MATLEEALALISDAQKQAALDAVAIVDNAIGQLDALLAVAAIASSDEGRAISLARADMLTKGRGFIGRVLADRHGVDVGEPQTGPAGELILPPKGITKLAFRRLFTPAERAEIRALRRVDPIIDDALDLLDAAEEVQMTDPDIGRFVGYLRDVRSVLSAARHAEVMAKIPVAQDLPSPEGEIL